MLDFGQEKLKSKINFMMLLSRRSGEILSDRNLMHFILIKGIIHYVLFKV